MSKTLTQPQAGFALIPIIVIVAALVVGSAAVGVGTYITNNRSEVTVSPTSQLELVDVSHEESQQQKLPAASDLPEKESSPTPEPTSADQPTKPVSKPVVAGIVQPAPTTQPSSTDTNVPLIVEQEFMAVFGRKPSASESEYWKERMRKNSFDRVKLRNLMEVGKIEQKQQPASNPNTANSPNSQPNTQALQNYIRLKNLLDSQVTSSTNTAPATTTPANTEPTPEELAAAEQQRQYQEEQARIAAEERAESIARCKAAEDRRYATALDTALNDLAERGLIQSGIRIRIEEDLRADHEYRLWQCERI